MIKKMIPSLCITIMLFNTACASNGDSKKQAENKKPVISYASVVKRTEELKRIEEQRARANACDNSNDIDDSEKLADHIALQCSGLPAEYVERITQEALLLLNNRDVSSKEVSKLMKNARSEHRQRLAQEKAALAIQGAAVSIKDARGTRNRAHKTQKKLAYHIRTVRAEAQNMRKANNPALFAQALDISKHNLRVHLERQAPSALKTADCMRAASYLPAITDFDQI